MSTLETNSSSLLSSEQDVICDKKDICLTRPFLDADDSSEEDIGDIGFECDPFNEIPQRLVKKEFNWTLSKKDKEPFKKTISLPILTKSHLIDFWKDFSNGEVYSLPTLGAGRCDSLQRISPEVMAEMVKGNYNIKYQVIDCRFSYEYNGGHIKDAINVSCKKKALKLFDDPMVYVFHCEFSSVRAPSIAQYVRNIDRNVNKYPKLTLPEIYILEGGYKKFYNMYPELCVPRHYVAMDDVKYKEIYRIESFNVKRNKNN